MSATNPSNNGLVAKAGLLRFVNMHIEFTGISEFDTLLNYGQVCLFNETHYTLIDIFRSEGHSVDDNRYKLNLEFDTDIDEITEQLNDEAGSNYTPTIEDSPHLFTKDGNRKELSYDVDLLILDGNTRAVTCLALEFENEEESLANIKHIDNMGITIHNNLHLIVNIPVEHTMFV